jgi:hypothetical protein
MDTDLFELLSYHDLLEKTQSDNQAILEKARKIYGEEELLIVKQFGTWAVTEYGLECLPTYYPIAKKDLRDTWNLLLHMSNKGNDSYGNLCDFVPALEAAQRHHYPKQFGTKPRWTITAQVKPKRQPLSPRLRFKVLKRDNYSCQICGKASPDGTTLHIDHKIPVSKGGKDVLENLWVLCEICNLGKSDNDL